MNRRTQAEFWLERLNQAWEAVIPLGKLETYEDQETLRVEGCRFFHLLLEGNIDMVSLSGTGKEWTLFQAGPLCLINDIPAITGIDNHVRYICCGQVRTVRFESRLLRDTSFFRSYPDLARNLLTTVLHKMEFFLSYAIEQQESSGLERLCRLLVQLTGGRQGCFSIGMGQKEWPAYRDASGLFFPAGHRAASSGHPGRVHPAQAGDPGCGPPVADRRRHVRDGPGAWEKEKAEEESPLLPESLPVSGRHRRRSFCRAGRP